MEQSRGRMARIAKKTKRYPSDLTDEEWLRIALLMPKPRRRGRRREVEFREVMNAVRYLVRSDCGWGLLPIHSGPRRPVYRWFRELARRFLFLTIHDLALMVDRERAVREASLSAGVIYSQSVKALQEQNTRLRRWQEDRWAQAAHSRRYRWAALDGSPDARRHLRQRRSPGDPGWDPQALALGQALVRRRVLRPA
jgi:transposase